MHNGSIGSLTTVFRIACTNALQYSLIVLQDLLDRLYLKYHGKDYLFSDPLEFVHRYQDPLDQEAVALVAALLAYGNVKQIRSSIEVVLERIHRLSEGPADFVRRLSDVGFLRKSRRSFSDFKHRFNIGADLIVLFQLLNRSWNEFGSLGAQFVSHLDPGDRNLGRALVQLMECWRGWAADRAEDSFYFFLTSPQDGSCCKRWCMFLRWMGRKDEVDPGLWTKKGALSSGFPQGRYLRSDQLIIPLDTHTGRITRSWKMTHRKNPDWQAALEVTEALRHFDDKDPVRFDFAICRLGMLGENG